MKDEKKKFNTHFPDLKNSIHMRPLSFMFSEGPLESGETSKSPRHKENRRAIIIKLDLCNV